jgi:hypothetical protein
MAKKDFQTFKSPMKSPTDREHEEGLRALLKDMSELNLVALCNLCELALMTADQSTANALELARGETLDDKDREVVIATLESRAEANNKLRATLAEQTDLIAHVQVRLQLYAPKQEG